MVKREASSGGPAFDDSDELSDPKKTAMLVKTLRAQNNGSTVWYDDQYNLTKATQPWRGLSVELCHGHPAAQRTLREIFDSVRGLGVSVGSFDQDISVDQFEPCYDPTHPHGPGEFTLLFDRVAWPRESIYECTKKATLLTQIRVR